MGSSYHGDKCFRERVMAAADISLLKDAVCACILRAAQQIGNHIVNRLSGKWKTAGSAYINYDGVEALNPSDDALYTLSQSYGGLSEEVWNALKMTEFLQTGSAVRETRAT